MSDYITQKIAKNHAAERRLAAGDESEPPQTRGVLGYILDYEISGGAGGVPGPDLSALAETDVLGADAAEVRDLSPLEETAIVLSAADKASPTDIADAVAYRINAALPGGGWLTDINPPNREPFDGVFENVSPDVMGCWVGCLGEAKGRKKPVRIDTEATHTAYLLGMAGEDLCARLAERLKALEEAFAAHVSDGHGGTVADVLGAVKRARRAHVRGDDVFSLDEPADSLRLPSVLGTEVDIITGEVEALSEAVSNGGGTPIPLSLPPWASDAVKCWQKDGQICCSMRLSGPDGKPRVLTACVPVEKCVDGAVDAMAETGVNVVGCASAIPRAAVVLGAQRLMAEMASAADSAMCLPDVEECEVVLGTMAPAEDATVEAWVELRKKADAGDPMAQNMVALARNTVAELPAGPDKDKAVAAMQRGDALYAGKIKPGDPHDGSWWGKLCAMYEQGRKALAAH